MLVADEHDPLRVRYRSSRPILAPETAEETDGVVPNVVFPTGVDDRGSGRVDVYYGLADQRIGVARLHVPVSLPDDVAPRQYLRIATASGYHGGAKRRRLTSLTR